MGVRGLGTCVALVLGVLGVLAFAGSPDAARRLALPVVVADLDNAGCVRCHAAQAEEWLGSSHQTAFTEQPFQTAIAHEPRAFCRACHAPLADPHDAETTDAARLGVACVSCHVREGSVLAAPGGKDGAPHPVTRSEAFASAEACAGCHEFDFPDAAIRDEPLAMQSTLREHAASAFADRSCASCHMPRADDGHTSHRFVASRDPELLRGSVIVAARRVDATTLEVTLRAGKVGHAVPTGDLLRRIEVGAVAERSEGEGRPRRTYLARHFGDRAQANGILIHDELRDDRVPPRGDRVVQLRLPDAEGSPVRWWVDYHRVAHQRSRHPSDAAIDGSVRLAQGREP